MTQNCLANYIHERAAFERLWEQDCSEPILLLRGASGCGKTSLLRSCRRAAPRNVVQVFIDCKRDGINAAEVFSRTADYAGRENLPAFTQWLQQHNVEIRDNQIEGNSNQINVVLNSDDEQKRRERLVWLTDAWLQDICQLDRPLLLAMDTYEKAGADLQSWLHSVISRLPRACSRLRIVLAGQKVPSTKTSEDWVDCCCEHILRGVPEAEHWLPVITERGFRVPEEPPLTFLSGICRAHAGNPARILEVIETFPRLL